MSRLLGEIFVCVSQFIATAYCLVRGHNHAKGVVTRGGGYAPKKMVDTANHIRFIAAVIERSTRAETTRYEMQQIGRCDMKSMRMIARTELIDKGKFDENKGGFVD